MSDANGAMLRETYPVASHDYAAAGEVSGKIKRTLKQLGIDSGIIRRVAVCTYEVELNIVIHSMGGDILLEVTPEAVTVVAKDIGPGIPDLSMAMREGYSTASDSVRTMGFGAGMGLPNMKRNATGFDITSEVGIGTTITMVFALAQG